MELSVAKLQHLLAVSACGSFSRAAAALHLSQPALSRSIAAIEEHYGFAIFNRLGHGVEATAAGLQLLEQAEPILQSLRVFEANMHLLAKGSRGRLAVGIAPLLASQLVSHFAARFFGATDEAQLRVMVRPGLELLQALRDDEIELMFFPESHLPESHMAETDEIEAEPVGHIRPVCVVRQGHPILDRGHLSFDDLAGFPWASSLESLIGSKMPSRSRMICDNYHILRDTLLTTNLICICSEAFVSAELRDRALVEIIVQGLPLPPTTIYVAKLRGRIFSPLAMQALDTIREYLAP